MTRPFTVIEVIVICTMGSPVIKSQRVGFYQRHTRPDRHRHAAHGCGTDDASRKHMVIRLVVFDRLVDTHDSALLVVAGGVDDFRRIHWMDPRIDPRIDLDVVEPDQGSDRSAGAVASNCAGLSAVP